MHSLDTKDLGCPSYGMQKRRVLFEATKDKRLDRSRKMLTVLKRDTKPALIIVPEGVQITVYLEMLEKNVLPWLKKCYDNKSYIFIQDGVPTHTSNNGARRTCQVFGAN